LKIEASLTVNCSLKKYTNSLRNLAHLKEEKELKTESAIDLRTREQWHFFHDTSSAG